MNAASRNSQATLPDTPAARLRAVMNRRSLSIDDVDNRQQRMVAWLTVLTFLAAATMALALAC
jgi:hypothetical protein